MNITHLESTIKELVIPGKGLLAADESLPTIKKRFDTLSIENTEENRRSYRELLITAAVEDYISGIILYEETLSQSSHGDVPFASLLKQKGIVPGIKVDLGLIPLENAPEEKVTQGIDGLVERLVEYKKQGARFAKWRATLSISTASNLPSKLAIRVNAELLGRYAAICQSQGIVPIVEPEILIDGTYTLDQCSVVTEKVLYRVFHALKQHHVILELMLLKPSMVLAGKENELQPSAERIAQETVKILRRTVPAAVPSINFLSGGQTEKMATTHLNEINKLGPLPWLVSFSYGRALQDSALKTWMGKEENVKAAQAAFIKRAKLNSLASQGKYKEEMEG